MTIDTFYFDAHNGITAGGWLLTGNAFDGNTGTSATSATTGTLIGQGTTASFTATDKILLVQVRTYNGGGVNQEIDVFNGATELLTGVFTTDATPTAYVTVPPPSGGWTLSIIQSLIVHITAASISATTNAKTEIVVYHTASAFYFPIMVGSSAGDGGTNAGRWIPLADTNDNAVATTITGGDMQVSAATLLSTWNFTAATSPGSGLTRTRTIQQNGLVTNLVVTATDPVLTGSNLTNFVSLAPLDFVAVKFTSTGTPLTSLYNYSIIQTGENQAIFGGGPGGSITVARFAGLFDSGAQETTAVGATQFMPENGSIKNFTAYMTSTLASGSYTVDLFIAGSSVVTLTLDATHQSIQDTGNTHNWNQGDAVYVQFTPNTPAAAKVMAVGGEYISRVTAGNFVLISSNGVNFGTTGTKFNNWHGQGAWNATESAVQARGAPSTLVGLYAVLSADTGAGKTRTVTFRKASVDTAATITFNNTGTTKTWTGSVSIADGDLINATSVEAGGTATNATVKYGFVLQAPPAVTLITQVAATLTATGGTQTVVAGGGAASASITQVAATLTATGGTQVVATINIVAIAQVAANLTTAGGTQTATTNSSNAQVAATLTITGGTQIVASVANTSIAQVKATLTVIGNTQTLTTINIGSIAQLAAVITATGRTQVIATIQAIALAQLTANITASGELQTISANSGTTTGDIKVYNGTSFIAKPVKVWNGAAWVKKPLKVYNGASWVKTSY